MSDVLLKQESSQQREVAFPWGFLALTFGFTWLFLLPGVLAYYDLVRLPFPALILVAVAQFGPSLAAFILAYRQAGKDGMKRLLKRAVDFHFPLRWLAIVVLVPLCLGALAVGLYNLTTGKTPQLVLLSQPLSIIANFFAILFFVGPVPEEFGWRGYLLDRLQARWSPLVSSLLIGVIWAVWHSPSWFMEGTFQSSMPFWAFLITNIALSILITWVYNHTGGTLALALLFHTTINLANTLFVYVEQGAGVNTRIFIYLTFLYAITAALVAVFSRSLGMARQNTQGR